MRRAPRRIDPRTARAPADRAQVSLVPIRRRRRAARLGPVVALLALLAMFPRGGAATTIGNLTTRAGDVPRRLVGYGLVVGLDGTGDRSLGNASGTTPTVRSVVNLLRRFNTEVPAERLRLRNVAAVLVTAEVSPYLRAGGRFEVQVSALGDATSLRGGVLWIAPLVTDPNQPPVATAQGALYVSGDASGRGSSRRANTGRIAEGGLFEIDTPAPPSATRLLLKHPDWATATHIAAAITAAFGANAARVEDPGSIAVTPPSGREGPNAFFAAVDTLEVVTSPRPTIVIDSREGTVVAGGDIRVGAAVISHRGITLEIGGAEGAQAPGLVRVGAEARVQDIAAGLHAAGARPEDLAAIFEALFAAGALTAQVVVR